jgi:cytochrome c6
MVLTKFTLFCLVCLTLLSCSGKQQNEHTDVSTVTEIKDLRKSSLAMGKELYMQNCIACHGTDGKMGMGGSADLTKSVMDTAEISEIINHGRKGMPAFKDILSDEDKVLSVTAFVLELRQ